MNDDVWIDPNVVFVRIDKSVATELTLEASLSSSRAYGGQLAVGNGVCLIKCTPFFEESHHSRSIHLLLAYLLDVLFRIHLATQELASHSE